MLNLKRMTLPDRDRRVVQAVGRFRQLTAFQVHELVFFGLASRTPCDRTLKRLVSSQYLARIEQARVAGGSKGGAGQYAYQLGRRGYTLQSDGKVPYRPARRVDYHQLLMADSYLALAKLHRERRLKIEGMAIDDAAWINVGGVDLRPDMLLDISRADGKRHLLWLEVDMATEGKKQVVGKLDRYWQVVQSGAHGLSEIPRSVWLACDDERAREMAWIINSLPDDGRRGYFKVVTLDGLSALFLS